jgi:hypothetical protein
MRIKHISVAALVAAFAIGSFPSVVLPTVAAAASQECGYKNENGKLVFLGTCANENGASSEDAPQQPNPCGVRLNGGPVIAYRMELAVC